MKSKLELQREAEWLEVADNFDFLVSTTDKKGEVVARHEELDEVLHKIKLDLITMGTHGGKSMLKVILIPKGSIDWDMDVYLKGVKE